MKKVTLFFICFGIFMMVSSTAKSQQKDTVYMTASEIKKMIDDKYYTRVPSTDLEQRLQDKVASVVNNKFSFIYGLIGVISFLIGGILLFNLRNVVGTRIDKELKETHIPPINKKIDDHIADINKKIDDHIADIKERIDDMKDLLKNKFSDLDKDLNREIENYFYKNFKGNMDAAVKELRQEQEKSFQAVEELLRKGSDIIKMNNDIRFDKLRANVEARVDLPQTFEGLKDLLAQADKSNDVDMISRVLNQLSYVTFYLKKDAEYQKMIDAYTGRPDVVINEASFVNVALGTLYDYQSTGDLASKEKALWYINSALKKTSDYGEALGLKLELFMTQYDNEVDDNQKKLVEKEIDKLLDIVNSKEIAAYETIARFRRVQASSAKSKYIELLYSVFPDKMKEMESIADNYKPARPQVQA